MLRQHIKWFKKSVFFLSISLAFLFGCEQKEKSAETQNVIPEQQPESTNLVVYSGRGEALVAPLFEKFTQATGIKVDVRYNTTGALATQALAEGKHTPADVFFFQEVGFLDALKDAGLLQTIASKLGENVIDLYRSKDNMWIGTSARLRVLAYNTNKLKIEDLPKALVDLVDPRWKGNKIGWAPTNASLQAHISALRHLWGEETTTEWLMKFKENQPVNYAKNAEQLLAVSRGEIEIAWVNHYYLYQLKKQQPDLPVANYSFPTKGDSGNILMVAGVGIRKDTAKQKEAEALIQFLLSDEAQRYITNEGFEYPTSNQVETNKELPALSTIDLAPVKQQWLSDVQPTLTLMQRLGLL